MFGRKKPEPRHDPDAYDYEWDFVGLSPQQTLDYIFTAPDERHDQLEIIRDNGLQAVPPIKPTVYLSSYDANKVVIEARGQVDYYWTYTISLKPTDNGTQVAIHVDTPQTGLAPNGKPPRAHWHINIMQINICIQLAWEFMSNAR